MMKAEGGAAIGIQRSPIGKARLQQREGADNVGSDEFVRTVDRAIDVALRSEMHHDVWRKGLDGGSHHLAVADIGAQEGVARMAGDGLQRLKVSSVGQLVDI